MTTVLVVDDEAVLTMAAALGLREAGFDVLEAYDGRNALDVMVQVPIDIVVTDYMMPRLSGLELAVALKEDPAFGSKPIVLTTAVPNEAVERHPGLFTAVLQKPYDLDRLVATVRNLADGSAR
jgi:CheY-like chemotaxis protein